MSRKLFRVFFYAFLALLFFMAYYRAMVGDTGVAWVYAALIAFHIFATIIPSELNNKQGNFTHEVK